MDERDADLCLDAAGFRTGNRAKLLRDGAEAYPRMLEAIRRAERLVLLEMYTFAEDPTGRRFAAALSERAQAGVDVRVLYDAIGSRDATREFFGRMRAQGIHVVEFHPLHRFWLGLQHRRRNHRKLLVVDGVVAFVGGLNLARAYAPETDGGLGWRDTQVELKGPVVADLAGMFFELWARERKRDPRPDVRATEPVKPGIPARVLSSHAFLRRWEIGQNYKHALYNARERIWIANPYFLPSSKFRRALRKAVRRGVDVRILVPARSDVAPALLASQRMFAKYLKWGIRIFEWPGPMMHAKTAVIDGRWSTIGSYNIDHLSLFHNYELTSILVGGAFGGKMETMFEQDFARCHELHLDEWKKRPVVRKVLEEVSFWFRTFF